MPVPWPVVKPTVRVLVGFVATLLAFCEVTVRVLQAPAVNAPAAGSVVKTNLVGPAAVKESLRVPEPDAVIVQLVEPAVQPDITFTPPLWVHVPEALIVYPLAATAVKTSYIPPLMLGVQVYVNPESVAGVWVGFEQ